MVDKYISQLIDKLIGYNSTGTAALKAWFTENEGYAIAVAAAGLIGQSIEEDAAKIILEEDNHLTLMDFLFLKYPDLAVKIVAHAMAIGAGIALKEKLGKERDRHAKKYV